MGVTPAVPAPIRRIGMFGGAFDPPHLAHLALARAAVAQCALDVLHIVPTGHAWHKSRTLSDGRDRLAMARLAFEGMPGTWVDDREVVRPGPTFTIDTLEALQAENPGAQLYLMMGADQFAAFRQWHRWDAILRLAIICIAGRPHSTWAAGQFDAFPGDKDRFLVLELPLMSTSATQIRQLAASSGGADSAIAQLVPEQVARYISEHQLYRSR